VTETSRSASARIEQDERVIRRVGKNLAVYKAEPPAASVRLERDGFVVLRGVLDAGAVAELAAEIERAFVERDVERQLEDRDEFRYQMLNYGPCSQEAVGHPAILEVIEPLLGDDCHVIANTAWRNPPTFAGGPWHCDAGPHVPRPEGVDWDDRIPYPVLAIGAHIVLKDCTVACGPTAVVPGSHRSGRLPPRGALDDPGLTYDGRPPVLLLAEAGDVALFVSDTWHRGTPSAGGDGRLFLQVHYGRRDIAQRIRPTAEVNHLTPEAIGRAVTPRLRQLVGLHDAYFYDG
jgi:ectoine hydroxylase-related dioxygenase (phytanoyl-CoA dioxygenase family)